MVKLTQYGKRACNNSVFEYFIPRYKEYMQEIVDQHV